MIPHFKKGQRVRLTDYAKRCGIRLRPAGNLGTVVVHSDEFVERLSVTVLPDGYKRPHTYHVDFWEPAG